MFHTVRLEFQGDFNDLLVRCGKLLPGRQHGVGAPIPCNFEHQTNVLRLPRGLRVSIVWREISQSPNSLFQGRVLT